MRLARVRCERGSVVAVLPIGSLEVNSEAHEARPGRVVGLDTHRVFAEAVMLDDGKVVRLGRIGMTRDDLGAFARTLTHGDHVVVEATGVGFPTHGQALDEGLRRAGMP